ncbi:hypothetical protein PGTUg99_029132 [Puccinia graminis f. sp. tritici]|uniref:Uncharacterized protein n=1 Tax=Puccinia graminis f. sp. tritici TaxID=56615 RepID=A0A5B0N0U1_PUCGR|nr:hypothetical protein PGTUg99_029132 [Puccinia graminis f. sp. tritici]
MFMDFFDEDDNDTSGSTPRVSCEPAVEVDHTAHPEELEVPPVLHATPILPATNS